MDNTSFENSIKVLTEFAEYVAEAYRKRIISGGNVNTGALINTINVNTPEIIGGQSFEVSLSLNRYYEYLEGGISPSGRYKNPGWRAFPHILEWIKSKPVTPRPLGGSGSLPSPKSLAYLITRSIIKKGIRPRPYMQMSVDEAFSAFNDRILEAFTSDVKGMVIAEINTMIRLTNHQSQ